jgi:hypothetical protein
MDPANRDLFRSGLQSASPYFSGSVDLLGQTALGRQNDQARTAKDISTFQQRDLPQILSTYGSFGSGRSSGLNNAIAGGVQGLGESLMARREDTQERALRDFLNLSQQLIGTRENEYGLMQKPRSGASRFFDFAAPAAGMAIGGFLGGPAGAAAGGSLAQWLRSLFDDNKSNASTYPNYQGLFSGMGGGQGFRGLQNPYGGSSPFGNGLSGY